MTQQEKAIKILNENNCTFVAINNEKIYTSDKRGVSPILDKFDEDKNFFCGATVADKVIGKAAAMLLVKYGVSEIFARIISDHAVKYLKSKQIKFTYEEKVEYIINRTKTDICPMEKTVLNISDEIAAEQQIRQTRKNLS